jgi:hypothetical protein
MGRLDAALVGVEGAEGMGMVFVGSLKTLRLSQVASGFCSGGIERATAQPARQSALKRTPRWSGALAAYVPQFSQRTNES